MYDFSESIKDAIVALAVGICGKSVYRRGKRWYYNEKALRIDDINIEFVPQTTEEETIIVNEKNKNPRMFKFYSNVE